MNTRLLLIGDTLCRRGADLLWLPRLQLYRPGADLFVVYNENWNAPTFSARETRDRQLIVEFTYLSQG